MQKQRHKKPPDLLRYPEIAQRPEPLPDRAVAMLEASMGSCLT